MTRSGSPAESYTYDGVGNRKTSLQVDGYTYNESNQLTELADGTTFTYDANGNMTSKTATGGTTGYSWDVENRLTQVTLAGGATVGFAYDPFGRRIRKSSASGTTVYVYDGANAVAEYDTSGILMARYTQGASIDEPLAMQRGGTTSYYDADGLGSVTSLTNAAGTISGTYIYSTFGQTSSTASIANPYQYTGRENDPETGLYYYRARYYDPSTGRFTSEDPVGFLSGNNFFAYAINDPTNLIDPSGLRQYPRDFTGPLQPGDTRGPYVVNIDSEPELSPLIRDFTKTAPDYFDLYGKNKGECVSLTRRFAHLPCTRCWRRGRPALGGNLDMGTAIATFDNNGHFVSGGDNSGLYVATIDNTAYILDQFPNKPHKPGVRPLNGPGRVNRGDAYYEILTAAPGECNCAQ